MYQLVREISTLDLARRQAPCLIIAFVTATLFYKLGSFALECAAFLATWFALDAAWHAVASLVTRDRRAGQTHA